MISLFRNRKGNSNRVPLSNKFKNNCKLRKTLSTLLLLFLILIPTITTYAGSGSDANKLKPWNDGSKIWQETTTNFVETSTKKMIEKFGGTVPANLIYGNTVKIKKYMGEVSDESDDYYNNQDKVFNTKRDFGEVKEDDVDKDVHAAGLTDDSVGFGITILGGISNALRSIAIFVFWVIVQVKEFNMATILGMFTDTAAGDSLFDTLKYIFLIDKEGNIAPFTMLFLILWVISMVGVTIKYMKGQEGFKIIAKELAVFILAIFLFALGICSGGMTKISELSQTIAVAFDNSLNDGNTYGIFDSNTGDDTTDVINKQYGLFVKANIENSLVTIFDVDSIDDLNLSNFTIPSNFTDKVAVSNGDESVENLGYMYWVGDSSVSKPSDPYDGGSNIVEMKGKETNRAYYLIPDILQESGGLDDENINAISKKMMDPSPGMFFLNSLIFLLTAIAFIYALFFALFILLEGKVLLAVSGILLLILPGLTLWDKTRRTAKSIGFMFISSLIRFVIGSVMFSMYLVMFYTMVSKADIVSEIITLAIFGLLAYISPKKILPAVDNMLREFEGNNAISRGLHNFNNSTYNRFGANKKYGGLSAGVAAAGTAGTVAGAAGSRILSKFKKKGSRGDLDGSDPSNTDYDGYSDPDFNTDGSESDGAGGSGGSGVTESNHENYYDDMNQRENAFDPGKPEEYGDHDEAYEIDEDGNRVDVAPESSDSDSDGEPIGYDEDGNPIYDGHEPKFKSGKVDSKAAMLNSKEFDENSDGESSATSAVTDTTSSTAAGASESGSSQTVKPEEKKEKTDEEKEKEKNEKLDKMRSDLDKNREKAREKESDATISGASKEIDSKYRSQDQFKNPELDKPSDHHEEAKPSKSQQIEQVKPERIKVNFGNQNQPKQPDSTEQHAKKPIRVPINKDQIPKQESRPAQQQSKPATQHSKPAQQQSKPAQSKHDQPVQQGKSGVADLLEKRKQSKEQEKALRKETLHEKRQNHENQYRDGDGGDSNALEKADIATRLMNKQ